PSLHTFSVTPVCCHPVQLASGNAGNAGHGPGAARTVAFVVGVLDGVDDGRADALGVTEAGGALAGADQEAAAGAAASGGAASAWLSDAGENISTPPMVAATPVTTATEMSAIIKRGEPLPPFMLITTPRASPDRSRMTVPPMGRARRAGHAVNAHAIH